MVRLTPLTSHASGPLSTIHKKLDERHGLTHGLRHGAMSARSASSLADRGGRYPKSPLDRCSSSRGRCDGASPLARHGTSAWRARNASESWRLASPMISNWRVTPSCRRRSCSKVGRSTPSMYSSIWRDRVEDMLEVHLIRRLHTAPPDLRRRTAEDMDSMRALSRVRPGGPVACPTAAPVRTTATR